MTRQIKLPDTFIFKSQIKARDSDGPDQAIDLNRPTYEQIHQMIFTDGTQNQFKTIDELKLEIRNLQALNIKGSLNFIMNLVESAPNWTVQSDENERSSERARSVQK